MQPDFFRKKNAPDDLSDAYNFHGGVFWGVAIFSLFQKGEFFKSQKNVKFIFLKILRESL